MRTEPAVYKSVPYALLLLQFRVAYDGGQTLLHDILASGRAGYRVGARMPTVKLVWLMLVCRKL